MYEQLFYCYIEKIYRCVYRMWHDKPNKPSSYQDWQIQKFYSAWVFCVGTAQGTKKTHMDWELVHNADLSIYIKKYHFQADQKFVRK